MIYNNGGDITISEAHFFENIGIVIENYQGGSLDIQKSILAKSSAQVENTAIKNENGVVLTQDTHYENLVCRGDITDNGGNTSDNARDCVGTDPHITDVVVENCRDFWGDGTLLDAVIIANAGGGEIRFTCDKIRVVSRLPIADDVRITGVNKVVLDGGGQNGIFRVEIGASLTLNHIQLQNGFAIDGSVIHNLGTLNIYNSTLTYNHALEQGAIYNWGGDVTIISSVFAHNKADFRGAAIYTSGGHLIIDDSLFFRNSARISGAIDTEFTPVRISNSDFVRNFARDGFGGVIGSRGRNPNSEHRQASPLIIINSHFERNYAGNIGGVINAYGFRTIIIGSTFYRNSSHSGSVIFNLWADANVLTINSYFILNREGCESCGDIYTKYLFSQHSYYESTICEARIVDLGGNMAVDADGCPGN